MKKRLLVLGAILALGMVGLAGLIHAAGFPTFVYLNGEGTSTGTNGVTFGGGGTLSGTQPSAAAGVPLILCTSPRACGWGESLTWDTAAGLSSTVQVYLLDCSITANCTSSTAMVDEFTLVTNTTQAVANSGGVGALRSTLTRDILDDLFHQGVAIQASSLNPDTVTASIVLGATANATNNTAK
jgi:hypothetical protein